jgi:hypothetical protein
MGIFQSTPLPDCDWHGCRNTHEIVQALKDPAHPGSVELMSLLTRGHPSPYLPYGGCLKSWPDMNRADKTIHRMSTQEQAEYADMVVRAVAHQPNDAMYYKILGGVTQIPMDADCTAVGGHAYFALYAANEGVRKHARAMLDAYMTAKNGK